MNPKPFTYEVNNFMLLTRYLRLMGFNPKTFLNFFRGIPFFLRDYKELRSQLKHSGDFQIKGLFPVLGERFEESGTLDFQYFYQDLLVARRVFENNPSRHIDIGSRIDGFVAHVASFRTIEVLDIRKQTSRVANIIFKQADLMKLPEDLLESLDSVSSLHAIEHFGLGRYSDSIDANGHRKALDNIYKILAKGGTFYFSVPIGPQRIEFNAHRVFSVSYLASVFKDKFDLRNFSYVDDRGQFFENVSLTPSLVESNFGCTYGCGVFELVKL